MRQARSVDVVDSMFYCAYHLKLIPVAHILPCQVLYPLYLRPFRLLQWLDQMLLAICTHFL